ncbi:trihelix transcription factor DF1-like [Gastrolobium bilobum]|uniref:trihelix transcription factor DF1-like n=1 Tax=Gastrolobium bilobum TaxID=150636 RepID=UPI002AB114D9|nr:trihelix transcription factor DF1-like [Gastrolobium bilobum]
MLGDSAVLGGGGGGGGGEGGGSGEAVAAVASAAAGTHDGAAAAAAGGGGVGSNSGDDERGRIDEGERSFGGNRWPRQETLALLRIRSDMDVAFRDASVKGPLWEEVSRKLAELGYHRSAKKCKEKFENVYKYHKRTKEGRSGKPDGKTYRFFDQLEALENHPSIQSPNSSKPPQPALLPAPPPPPPVSSLVVTTTTTTTTASSVSLPTTTTTSTTTVPMPLPHATVPSTSTLPIPLPQPILTPPSINLTIPSFPPTNPTNFPPSTTIPISFANIPTDLLSNSSSSSTSSDQTLEGRRKRKRKWKDFFERLMKEVIDKQEELQRRFLEAIEKREHERMVREEAWRVQEMQRINREREILAQERSIAAAKDAAVMSFLQKIAEQQNLGQAFSNINILQQQQQQQQQQPVVPPPPPPPPPQQAAPAPPPVQQPAPVAQAGPPPSSSQALMLPLVPQQQVTNMEIVKANNNGENFMGASSSRWPKVEVQALIKLRTNLDFKYQENGPKGPLWEEISSSMRKLGYNRSSKRCKEKWENINKYFKKVKESNKKRPEDSKTCPYFHQLDALYREKNKFDNTVVKPESMVAPLMVRPEQQWPPQQIDSRAGADRDVTMEDVENDPMERHHQEEEDDEDEEEKDIGEDDDDDEEDDGNYEIVASKPATSAAAGTAATTSVGASAE